LRRERRSRAPHQKWRTDDASAVLAVFSGDGALRGAAFRRGHAQEGGKGK